SLCLTITATHKVARCEKTEQDRSPSFLDGRRAAGRYAGRYDEAHRGTNPGASRLHQRRTGARDSRPLQQRAAYCQREADPGRGNDGGRQAAEETLSVANARIPPGPKSRNVVVDDGVKACSTRTALIFVIGGTLLFSACGGRKAARSHPPPPPPTITPSQPAPDA